MIPISAQAKRNIKLYVERVAAVRDELGFFVHEFGSGAGSLDLTAALPHSQKRALSALALELRTLVGLATSPQFVDTLLKELAGEARQANDLIAAEAVEAFRNALPA